MIVKFLLALLLTVYSLNALEEEKAGPYVTFGYGKTLFNDKGYLQKKAPIQNSFNITAGAYINTNLSVELDYASLGAFTQNNIHNENVTNTFNALGVSTLAHYPFFNNKLDTNVKFGVANLLWSETNDANHGASAVSLIYGLGFSYELFSNYTLKFAYDYYSFELYDQLRKYNMEIHRMYTALEVKF